MTAVTDLSFGSHSVTSDFSPPPHTHTHTLEDQVPCWFAVYGAEPLLLAPRKGSLVSREASSWMELLCSSPESFDPVALHPPNQPCQPGEGGGGGGPAAAA